MTAATATRTDKVTAPALAILESTWAAIRRHQKDLPLVAFVIGAGTGAKDGSLTAGHFAPATWADDTDAEFARHEVFIAGELLKAGPTQVMATLLHEATHALAHVRGIKDTSRGGRYHNAAYKALAEELGLSVVKVGSIGWSGTSLTPAAAQVYLNQLTRLANITAHRRPVSRAQATGRKSSNNGVAACCPTCGRKVRVSRAVLDQGPIVCWPCLMEDSGLAEELAETLAAYTFAAEEVEEEDA